MLVHVTVPDLKSSSEYPVIETRKVPEGRVRPSRFAKLLHSSVSKLFEVSSMFLITETM